MAEPEDLLGSLAIGMRAHLLEQGTPPHRADEAIAFARSMKAENVGQLVIAVDSFLRFSPEELALGRRVQEPDKAFVAGTLHGALDARGLLDAPAPERSAGKGSPMLLRFLMEATANGTLILRQDLHGLDHAALSKALASAARFVFSDAASDAVLQLVERTDQLDAAHGQIFAPYPITWVEFAGRDYGALWVANDQGGRSGLLLITTPAEDGESIGMLPIHVDLDQDIYLRLPDRVLEMAEAAPLPHLDYDPGSRAEMLQALQHCMDGGRMMLASWAVLATKGMTSSVETDFTKLNKHRERKGLIPLLSYRTIRLNLDAERAVRARGGVATGTTAQHAVRSHIRLIPSGRVVIVKAHMRGNPEFGVRVPQYSVERGPAAS